MRSIWCRACDAERNSTRRLIVRQYVGFCFLHEPGTEHDPAERSRRPCTVSFGIHKSPVAFQHAARQAGRVRSSLRTLDDIDDIAAKPQIPQARSVVGLGSEVEFEGGGDCTAHTRQPTTARVVR